PRARHRALSPCPFCALPQTRWQTLPGAVWIRAAPSPPAERVGLAGSPIRDASWTWLFPLLRECPYCTLSSRLSIGVVCYDSGRRRRAGVIRRTDSTQG